MLGDKNKACRQLVCTNKEKRTDNSFNRVTQIEIDSVKMQATRFFRKKTLKHIADQSRPSSMEISD